MTIKFFRFAARITDKTLWVNCFHNTVNAGKNVAVSLTNTKILIPCTKFFLKKQNLPVDYIHFNNKLITHQKKLQKVGAYFWNNTSLKKYTCLRLTAKSSFTYYYKTTKCNNIQLWLFNINYRLMTFKLLINSDGQLHGPTFKSLFIIINFGGDVLTVCHTHSRHYTLCKERSPLHDVPGRADPS